MRVFIADDSALIRKALAVLLSGMEGVEICGEADTGETAIAAISKLNPDAVVLDVRMPDGSGLDVLKAIKKGGTAPMVIMLTNYAIEPYRQSCLQAGADYFFDKSTEFHKLGEVLKELL